MAQTLASRGQKNKMTTMGRCGIFINPLLYVCKILPANDTFVNILYRYRMIMADKLILTRYDMMTHDVIDGTKWNHRVFWEHSH